MRISCSKAQSISSCGRQYNYRYVQRLTTIFRAFALFFGSVVDHAVSGYVYNHALGKDFDILTAFEDKFDAELKLHEIQYPQHWDADVAREVGQLLCTSFPEEWEKTGLVAAIDQQGTPIVQRRIYAPLPQNHELEMILDAIVMNTLSGDIGVLDFKTTSVLLSPEGPFGYNSFQLTTYQYGADYEFGQYLGPIKNVGFMEFAKRKPPQKTGKGPTIEAPRFFPRRNKEQINDMVRTYLWKAQDILEKRFHRPVNNLFNSPCEMCDFARLCVNDDNQGIIVKKDRRAA